MRFLRQGERRRENPKAASVLSPEPEQTETNFDISREITSEDREYFRILVQQSGNLEVTRIRAFDLVTAFPDEAEFSRNACKDQFPVDDMTEYEFRQHPLALLWLFSEERPRLLELLGDHLRQETKPEQIKKSKKYEYLVAAYLFDPEHKEFLDQLRQGWNILRQQELEASDPAAIWVHAWLKVCDPEYYALNPIPEELLSRAKVFFRQNLKREREGLEAPDLEAVDSLHLAFELSVLCGGEVWWNGKNVEVSPKNRLRRSDLPERLAL